MRSLLKTLMENTSEPKNFKIRITVLIYNPFLLPANVRDFEVSIKHIKTTEHVKMAHHQDFEKI